MKLSKLSWLVLSGLYAGGATAATQTVMPNSNLNTLHGLQVSAEQLSERQHQRQQQQQRNNGVTANDGINVHVRGNSSKKFVAEPDLVGEHVYIIQLHDAPLATYQGGIAGIAATSPSAAVNSANGQTKLYKQGKAQHDAVGQYRSFLQHKQQQALSDIAGISADAPRRHYVNALNGFSMSLTQAQAAQIATLGSVKQVQRSTSYELHTDVGPQLISADKAWDGTTTQQTSFKGEGVVVAILDTGVNTDHAAFADVGGDGFDHSNPWGAGTYVGDCEANADLCNDKLIGVRSYPEITATFAGIAPAVGEDYNGHGSHTASTAAGNVQFDVDYLGAELEASGDGKVLKEDLFPRMSGVAPHANIVSYQVCLPLGGCPGEAMLAAIEDSISDGVDVINFSIGGVDHKSPWDDSVQLAFLSANQAGIAIAASAGNSGGQDGTEYLSLIDNVSPWLLTVGASSTGRTVNIDTRITDPALASALPSWSELSGGGINTSSVTGIIVKASDYGDEQCLTPFAAGTFDDLGYTDADGNPANIIVACGRGEIARVAKATNAAAGGAEGFILYNTQWSGDESTVIETDSYDVPGIHISTGAYYGDWTNNWNGLESWLNNGETGKHQVTISATSIDRVIDPDQADVLALFSSRGPSLGNPEHLVPSVTAPGVDIYAAYRDEAPFEATEGEIPTVADYAFLSGTSMASPHVAGALALLTEARPDWTPAQKHAALQMTAEPEVTMALYPDTPKDERYEAVVYRAGTGRINVASAIDAPLTMKETHDNFLAANPDNGGEMHRLNVPELVNLGCKNECQWLRTFTATEAGTYTITQQEVYNFAGNPTQQYVQPGIEVQIHPQTFELAAGESQNVMFSVDVIETQDALGNSDVELHSHLLIDQVDGDAPQMQIPMAFRFSADELPTQTVHTVHRDNGSQVVKDLRLPQMDTPFGRVFAPVKAEIKSVTLPKDSDGVYPWSEETGFSAEQMLDESVHTEWVTVPEGAQRLVLRSFGTTFSDEPTGMYPGHALLYVGRDLDEDGVIEPNDEIVCVSRHAFNDNYCNLNQPTAGNYWALIYNPTPWVEQPEQYVDTLTYALAVITDEVASDISISLPSSNGSDAIEAELSWDMTMTEGDMYFGAWDVGTSATNPGNQGMVPMDLIRGSNDVSLNASHEQQRAGEQVQLQFTVLPNHSGRDRAFSISATIPEQLLIDPANISVSHAAAVDSVELVDGVLTISGVQSESGDLEPGYTITTSADDALCRSPDLGQAEPGGYIDLAEFGINPSYGDDPSLQRQGLEVPFDAMRTGEYTEYAMLNNYQQAGSDFMRIRGMGTVAFTDMPVFFPAHYPIPLPVQPENFAAVMQRGWGGVPFGRNVMATPLDWDSGISIASTDSGWVVVEFDDARTMPYQGFDPSTGTTIYGDNGDRLDFELLFHMAHRFGDGEYEMMMAYDNLNFNGDVRGSVGVQGRAAIEVGYDNYDPIMGVGYAFNDLDQKLSDDLLVCYDYVGPESSQFNVTVPATVNSSASGQTLTINASSDIDGMGSIDMTHTIAVAGNISLGQFADIAINEDSSTAPLTVVFADQEASANTISVSGEHISAQISGHNSGDTVVITPDADFNGSTEVTITVADIDNPSDAASRSFMLHVAPMNDAPTMADVNASSNGLSFTVNADVMDVDGDSLSYNWSQTAGPDLGQLGSEASLSFSNVAAGDYGFSVVVSDGSASVNGTVTVTVAENVNNESSSSSSGSFGFLALMGLALAGLRRRIR
ncbi:S8 family serine peptidase [uncultured Ferrimonas sp.]|uniref:S8 family serine peptidase n=1 Tax=uncultured Ferrimonas sp. TaxID=432640 RepID=UPI002631BE1A|nr:S8 family serine peptidase [uncultured Ferrimonas sp.]